MGGRIGPALSREQLAAFFRPRNVALVGASDRSPWSTMIAARFAEYGHAGKRFAVNRGGRDAHGLPGFVSVRDIPEPVDMAYILVPAHAVEGALRDAASAGVRHAVVLSSGFAEAGADGAALQARLVAAATQCGIALLGPNSLGFANIAGRACCTSMRSRLPLRAGGLAVVSQSGAIAVELAKWAHTQDIGLSFLCATGNEAQIGIPDVVDYLIDDPATRAIALYVEGFGDPARFMRAAARARAVRKPVVLLKIGRSAVSAAVVQAHTGALAGDDRVFDAMCAAMGVIRTSSIEELIATAEALGRIGPIDPPAIGAASISGGACSMYADLAALHGLSVPAYAPGTRAQLAALLPGFAASLNPLDVTGVALAEPDRWRDIIPVLAGDPGIGLVVTIFGLPNSAAERQSLDPSFAAIAAGYRTAGSRPAIMNVSLQECHGDQAAIRGELGLDTVLPNLELGVRALAHLERWSRAILGAAPPPAILGAAPPAIQETAAPDAPGAIVPAGGRPASERDVLAYLSARGVPVVPAVLAADADQAVRAARDSGGAVVLKIASPDIAHKTEAGGVRLGLDNDAAVAQAHDQIIASVRAHRPDARIDGVIVMPLRRPATELIVGVLRDPQWGPALVVGFGGVLAEVLQDTQLSLLPVSPRDVRAMLDRLRGAALLAGFRGTPAADMERLTRVIAAIGDAALALGPDLVSLEVNPLRVDGGQIECLDGLAIYA